MVIGLNSFIDTLNFWLDLMNSILTWHTPYTGSKPSSGDHRYLSFTACTSHYFISGSEFGLTVKCKQWLIRLPEYL